MDKDEMLRPPIDARIEKFVPLIADAPDDLLLLASVAERTAPGEVIDMVWSAMVAAGWVIGKRPPRISRP